MFDDILKSLQETTELLERVAKQLKQVTEAQKKNTENMKNLRVQADKLNQQLRGMTAPSSQSADKRLN